LTAIVALTLLGLLLRARSPRPAKSAASPRVPPSGKAAPVPAPATKPSAKSAPSPAPPPKPSSKAAPAPVASLKVADEAEDLDFTLVRTSPLTDEIAKIKAERAAVMGSLPSIATSPVEEEESDGEREPSRVELMFEDDEAAVEEATSPVARILISACGDSDQGRKRKQNEDSLLLVPAHSLFVVADGMGGYAGGEVASALAIDTIQRAFDEDDFRAQLTSDKPLPRRAHELACAMQMANDVVVEFARAEPKLADMGTTTVAARFSARKERVYIGHLGDSRCYRLRGKELRQLTSDHTLASLGAKGPKANELVRALGIGSQLEIDLIVDKPRSNDIYLLCSDGLTKMVPDEDIRDILLGEADLEAAVYSLIEQANDRGGKDNVTVILVKVVERMNASVIPR
jgi:protein phosphatase